MSKKIFRPLKFVSTDFKDFTWKSSSYPIRKETLVLCVNDAVIAAQEKFDTWFKESQRFALNEETPERAISGVPNNHTPER